MVPTYLLVVPSILVFLLLAEHTTAIRLYFSPALHSWLKKKKRKFGKTQGLLDNITYVRGEFPYRGTTKFLHNPIPTTREVLFFGVRYRVGKYAIGYSWGGHYASGDTGP